MMSVQSKDDLIWFQGTDGSDIVNPGDQFLRAREALLEFLAVMKGAGVPHEFIYCPVSYTSNVVFPIKLMITPGLSQILEDGGYKMKIIPEKTDAQASKELREALLGGADFGTKWH